ncbi:MAG: hypothetical protein LBQ66_06625, partial [Planctomycetaceae bacterium]|nr:hypothetical protein [Planctomycetaceae bacterium]
MSERKFFDLRAILPYLQLRIFSLILFLFLFLWAIGICVLFSGAEIFAQSPPTPPPSVRADAENVHRDQIYDRFRIEQQIQQSRSNPLRPQIKTPQPPPIDLTDKASQKFKLNEIIFEPIPKSISHEELQAVARKYIERESVDLRDIYLMLTEIDGLFDSRSVVGRAVLPVQDVVNGIVRVNIIEARIGKVKVEVKRPSYPIFERGKPEYIPSKPHYGYKFVKKHFNFNANELLNTKKLEDELLRFNRRFRSQLAAEVEPGDEHGLSDLKLTFVKPQPLSASFFVDNSGRENSGLIRTGFFAQLQGNFGLDESFFVSYDETDGTSMLLLSAGIPLTRFGTFFDVSYDYGTPRTIDGPFAPLNIHGTSERIRPSFRQILRNEKKTRLDGTISVETYKSKTWFDQDLNYEEDLMGITVGLDYSRRNDKSSVYRSLSVTAGNAGTASASPDMEYADFCLLRASIMRVWNPNSKWTIIFRGNGHAALTDIPQSQVFQIGGMATVRGVQEGLMSGDSGYLLSIEGRREIWNNARFLRCCLPSGCEPVRREIFDTRLEAFGFVDHGGVFYRNYPPSLYSSDYIFSIGFGGILNVGKYVSVTGGFGQPIFTALSHQSDFRRSLKETRG